MDNIEGQQKKEIQEAIKIGNELIRDIDSAIHSLGSAKSWATYDMFFKKGLFSHLFKYDNINKANQIMSNLEKKIKIFKKELEDVNSHLNYSMNTYTNSLKAIDYFFDNVFTDYHVRNKIIEDKNSLLDLKKQINNILFELKSKI